MTTIVKFLAARLNEDEAMATAASGRDPEWWETGPGYPEAPEVRIVNDRDDLIVPGVGELEARHIARHDPARVLREVEAKRAIVALHGDYYADPCLKLNDGAAWDPTLWEPCDTLKLMAVPDADHPDYNPAWSVE